MANGLFTKFVHNLGLGVFDFSDDDFAVGLFNTPGGFNAATNEFLDDIESGLIQQQDLDNVTWVDATFDADNVLFANVTGTDFDLLAVWKKGSTSADSPLIGYWQGTGGLPISINNGDVFTTWNGSGIATLSV